MKAGDRLGDYEVLSELGRGGCASVVKARARDGSIVAIKVLPREANDAAFTRFIREQKLLGSLGEAEGFVPILASGIAPQGAFFVMPLMTGGTLRDRLTRGGALEIEETIQLGRQLGAAIGWAHERGIVHRDLKPENILFTRDGRPLIADLGIAKHFTSTTSAVEVTKVGSFLGTPLYMAPEQMDCSKEVNAQADVFSLGVILYECLAGRTPFHGETLQETVARVTDGRYQPLEDVRIDVPHFVSHPIAVALSKDLKLRYKNGFDFAHSFGARMPQQEPLKPTEKERPAGVPAPAPRPPVEAPVATAAVRPRVAGRRWRPLWVLAGIVGLGSIATASYFVVDGILAKESVKEGPPAPSSSPPPPPRVVPLPQPKGWFGETLPAGVRLGAEKPVYVYDTKKGLELEVVYVPPGEFYMGAINGNETSKPIHMHPMPRGYYIGRTEVTWDQYRVFCRATGHAEPPVPGWPITGRHPVVNVSWFDAVAFCEWAGMALPSEAEWEKAARGGDDSRQWPWGDKWLPGRANVLDESCPIEADPGVKVPDDGFPYTAPVNSFPAGTSPYGAADMAGNVEEWCADWFDQTIYLAYSNGREDAPYTGANRAVRGGGWRSTNFGSAADFRSFWPPTHWAPWIGFRPILHPPTKK